MNINRKNPCWPDLVLTAMLAIAMSGQGQHPLNPGTARHMYNAALTANSVPMGEPVILQLRYTNCKPDTPPTIPEIDGLTVTYEGPLSSSNISIVNGRRTETHSVIHQFNIVPEKVGTYTIPAIESKIQGKTYTTRALRLTASKGRDYSQYAFIRVQISKQEVYVGEVFQMAVELFELNAKLEEKPVIPSDGFVIDEVGQPSQSRTQVGNSIYDRVTFHYLVRAVKTGELSIGPVTWKVPLYLRNNSARRQRGAFNSFFPGFVDLGSTVRRDVTLEYEPASLNVKPLPEEGQPDSFNGGVGKFTMDVQASPTDVTAGDPITITMRIRGRGALEALQMPSFESWREFKQYPETATVTPTDKLGLSGIKTFEKIVIPNNAEIESLPEIELSFFDPLEERYKTLTQPPIPLVVKPNLTTATQPTIVANAGPNQPPLNIATNIVHIKPRLDTISTVSPPWLRQPAFLWLQVIPLAAWIASYVYRTRRNTLNRNPRALRKKRVKTVVERSLRDLRDMAARNQSSEFFATLFRLLQEQIGERLDLPANAITEAVIETKLRNHGLDSETRNALDQLFQICNQSRYASVNSSEELVKLTERAERALVTLQNLPDSTAR